MKTIIKLIIAVLLCTADLSAGNPVTKTKNPYHLIVEGEFLAQKHVRYTVYKMDEKTGVFKSESHNKARKYFSVVCDKGSKYIIRFQDKNRNVKFLLIEATSPGYFEVNVDFKNTYDGLIKYTKNGYSVTLLTNSGIKPG